MCFLGSVLAIGEMSGGKQHGNDAGVEVSQVGMGMSCKGAVGCEDGIQ